jgi:hypothetical protein
VPSSYPASLDTFTDPVASDSMATVSHSTQHTHANDAVAAVQATLGINPQDGSATVAARLATMGSAAGITYDPTTSAGDSGTPIPAYLVQEALDFLNRDITDRDEQTYLVAKRDTLLAVYALAGANPQVTVEGTIPGFAPSGATSFNSGTAVTLQNPTVYPLQNVTLNGAAPVLTLPNAYAGAQLTVVCRQDGTGGRVGTFAAASGDSVKWPAATAPTLTTTANTVDVIRFTCAVTKTWLGYRTATDVR